MTFGDDGGPAAETLAPKVTDFRALLAAKGVDLDGLGVELDTKTVLMVAIALEGGGAVRFALGTKPNP